MNRDSYTWQEDTNQANIETHGISFNRAVIILLRGNPVHGIPYERKGEQRIQSVGQVNDDTIAVIHTQENDQRKILSAHRGRTIEVGYIVALEAQGGRINRTFDPEFAAWRDLDKNQQRRSRPAYVERQQRDRQELAAAQHDPSKDIEAIKERQRVEAIAARAPRLARDQIERAELVRFLAERRLEMDNDPTGHGGA